MDLVKCKKCSCEEFIHLPIVNLTADWVSKEEYDYEKGVFKRSGGPSPFKTASTIVCLECGTIYGTNRKITIRKLKE